MKKVKRQIKSAFNLPSITLEGGLFLPDQLENAALGQADHQGETDYQIPKGLKLKDEFSRAFQIASAQWKQFAPQLQRTDLDEASVTSTFVEEFLRDALGYTQLKGVEPITVNERSYPISLLAGHVPVVVAPFDSKLDDSLEAFAITGSGSRKKSAFQLAQELLNGSDEHLWALVSNGKQLRLLRDAASLTRPSFLEFDLEDILQGQRFAEFATLWRLLHGSRANQTGAPESCIWEAWREQGKNEGTRVREGLSKGVRKALLILGEGFIQHPSNQNLRKQLEQGELDKRAYLNELLRLIYRLIFLFTVEERGLLHPQPAAGKANAKADQQARRAYAQGYALARLREACLQRHNLNRFDDQWQSLRIVFAGLADGQPLLALPALGGLFSKNQCEQLDVASLSNLHLLSAMRHLRWATHDGSPVPIDYRNMGPEELGSVYETLLELVPEIELSTKSFGFIGYDRDGNKLESTKGNERKETGSYYTPDSLVQELIKSALEPVIQQKLHDNPSNPTQALLSIRVIDPSCGSGHFLLAAARRLAQELAQQRTEDGAVKPADYRQALHDVIANCIFGVDRNPMALELARMALWLEGFDNSGETGQPLSFLDHHLQCGDALLGLTDLSALEYGIPKAAFKALSGDEKPVCTALGKANTAALKQLEKDRKSPQFKLPLEQASQLAELQAIESMPQRTTKQIAKQEAAYLAFLDKAKNSPLRHAADMLLGAFLMAKTEETEAHIPTTAHLYLELVNDQHNEQHLNIRDQAMQACRDASVFHWSLAYPQVFAQGGFDCVLGNPPWEVVQDRDAQVSSELHQRMKVWFGVGNYELLSGRRDLYKLFLAIAPFLIKDNGRLGFLLPIGFMFESDCQSLRQLLFDKYSVLSVLHLQNAQKKFFLEVHASYRFIGLTFLKGFSSFHKFSPVVKSPAGLESIDWIEISRNNFDGFIGSDRSAVVYNNQLQAQTHQGLIKKSLSLRQLNYQLVAEFHASSDKELFTSRSLDESDWTLLKNGSIHQFKPYFGPTEKWTSVENVRERLGKKGLDADIWCNIPRLVFRDIARSDDTRTLIPCLVPPGFVSTYDAPMIVPSRVEHQSELPLAFYAAYLSSFLADYLIRPYVDKHIKGYVLSHVPIPEYKASNPYMKKAAELSLKLATDSWQSNNLEEDFLLVNSPTRIILEALFFKIIQASGDEIENIFFEFSGIQKENFKLFGEYRTQRLVLEAWDKLEAGDLVDTSVRRKDPLKEYFAHGTPASETEDWWAGVVCDVLLQKGPVDDNNLLLILLTNLSESTSEVSALVQWLEPLSSSRWQQVFNWLRSLLKVPGPQLLSISDPSLLSDVLGDHRTEALAKALISARAEQERKLTDLMSTQTTSSEDLGIKVKKG